MWYNYNLVTEKGRSKWTGGVYLFAPKRTKNFIADLEIFLTYFPDKPNGEQSSSMYNELEYKALKYSALYLTILNQFIHPTFLSHSGRIRMTDVLF